MFETIEKRLREASYGMAMLSGCAFLLLAIYTTIDVTSRKLGGPFTGITDNVAALVMAFGGTWSLAYALASDAHVKIDVLQGHYSPAVARLSIRLALLTTTIFSAVLAFEAWDVAYRSWLIGAWFPQSIIEIQLSWPQAITAVGYTVLVLQGAAMLALDTIRPANTGMAEGDAA